MQADHEQVAPSLYQVLDEAMTYVEPHETSLVIRSHATLVNSLGPASGLHEGFAQQSLATALHLAKLGLGVEYLACALLSYPLYTRATGVAALRAEFGDAVGHIAQTLARLAMTPFEANLPWNRLQQEAGQGRRPPSGRPEKRKPLHWQAETVRRTPLAILKLAESVDTVLLKVVDRLHLLQWSKALGLDDGLRRWLAEQSIDVYAVLADMLGIWSVKSRLEDVAFGILQPEAYAQVTRDLREQWHERKDALERARTQLARALADGGMQAEVVGRAKHAYSVYNKVRRTGKQVQQLNDILGLRVVVETKDECYRALGLLWELWPPAAGIYGERAYRDWIEKPKPNGYRSLHTTVVFEGSLLEVQIRTRAMHQVAEYGAAAHWHYKRSGGSPSLRRDREQREIEQVAELRRRLEAGRLSKE